MILQFNCKTLQLLFGHEKEGDRGRGSLLFDFFDKDKGAIKQLEGWNSFFFSVQQVRCSSYRSCVPHVRCIILRKMKSTGKKVFITEELCTAGAPQDREVEGLEVGRFQVV